LFCELIFFSPKPAENFPVWIHRAKLDAEAVLDLNGFFVVVQGGCGFTEMVGELGEFEVESV
jgi:hypothetical protein